ncbi:MAG TPA: NAD(+)--rifampin ADP-ribosyltransferase [Candidatus Limnocylindrales bacterium]
MADTPDASSLRYYHGTKADLKRGDLIEPGHPPGSKARPKVHLTSSLDAAAWEAELAVGDGPGRIYIVEPIGLIVEDPDPAHRKFPWPAKVYGSAEPLLVTGECTDQQGRPLRFYHGTKADLKPGDLIEPGHAANFGKRDRTTTYVYLTGTLDAATWGAELAVGDGSGRIYIVEPTGPITDDPDLTSSRYPGNPTKSYRSREPLWVTGEVAEWQGHSPEALKAMKDGLERLRNQGVEPID